MKSTPRGEMARIAPARSATIDRLSADPAIRERFQLLTFRYDSLHSIEESGDRLAEALEEARQRLDPEGVDPSFEEVVLAGHSMGGLVAKAAAGNYERRKLKVRQVQAVAHGPARRPHIGRFVFIATPHRGVSINRGAIRSAGSWMARTLRSPSKRGHAQTSSVDL